MHHVLLVEDDSSLREVLDTLLSHEGFLVTASATAEEALPLAQQGEFSCVLADFRLPRENGLWLLQEIRKVDRQLPFVLMTAYGSIEIAVEALKNGANDFLTKPFEPQQVSRMLKELVARGQIFDRNTPKRHVFMTTSASARVLLQRAKKVAAVDTSVLLTGESGTGKELIARYLHEHSARRDNPFYAVNCAAMPEQLLESELFGHVEGAFTGATRSRMGLFEAASLGTLFLDEVGEMAPSLQVKLLRALQEHEIRPVGSTRQVAVSPRIIAATNVDIAKALDTQQLREDFYYRIAVVTLSIPPLRERPDDIDFLAQHFLTLHHSRMGGTGAAPRFHSTALDLLHSYTWPGNARELENVIERALILSNGEIRAEHLGIVPNLDYASIHQASMSLHEIAEFAARKAESETITRVLSKTSGNKAEAARLLGVSYKTLLTKVKEYNL